MVVRAPLKVNLELTPVSALGDWSEAMSEKCEECGVALVEGRALAIEGREVCQKCYKGLSKKRDKRKREAAAQEREKEAARTQEGRQRKRKAAFLAERQAFLPGSGAAGGLSFFASLMVLASIITVISGFAIGDGTLVILGGAGFGSALVILGLAAVVGHLRVLTAHVWELEDLLRDRRPN